MVTINNEIYIFLYLHVLKHSFSNYFTFFASYDAISHFDYDFSTPRVQFHQGYVFSGYPINI